MINAFIFELNQLVTFVKVGTSTHTHLTHLHTTTHKIYVNVQDVDKTTEERLLQHILVILLRYHGVYRMFEI